MQKLGTPTDQSVKNPNMTLQLILNYIIPYLQSQPILDCVALQYVFSEKTKEKIHIFFKPVQTRAVKGFTVLYERADTQAEMLQSVEQTKLKFQERVLSQKYEFGQCRHVDGI